MLIDDKIKPQYEHTKYGNFMFFICAKVTKLCVRHRWLYYLLNFTWGFLTVLFGLLVYLGLFIASLFDKAISFGKYC